MPQDNQQTELAAMRKMGQKQVEKKIMHRLEPGHPASDYSCSRVAARRFS
jgi:hypothetical protein